MIKQTAWPPIVGAITLLAGSWYAGPWCLTFCILTFVVCGLIVAFNNHVRFLMAMWILLSLLIIGWVGSIFIN